MMSSNREKLRVKSKNTAYARFFSARRYKKLNSYSLFSLTVASFSLIFMTLVDKYSDPKLFIESTLDLIQLISAIIIAAISLAISLSNYSEKSIKMLKSGEDFNELVRKLENLSDDDYEQQKNSLNAEYNSLIKNSENHQEFEFIYGKNERKREENKREENNGVNNSEISYYTKLKNYTTLYSFISISVIYITFVIVALILFTYRNGLFADSQKTISNTTITDKGIVEKNVKSNL